jgi:hypothetical protein
MAKVRQIFPPAAAYHHRRIVMKDIPVTAITGEIPAGK